MSLWQKFSPLYWSEQVRLYFLRKEIDAIDKSFKRPRQKSWWKKFLLRFRSREFQRGLLMKELEDSIEEAVKKPHHEWWTYHGEYSDRANELQLLNDYLQNVVELSTPEEVESYLDRIWELTRQQLNSRGLQWNTMCWLFEWGLVAKWSSHSPVPVDVLVAADRAVKSWGSLKCGNRRFSLYNFYAAEHLERIIRNLASFGLPPPVPIHELDAWIKATEAEAYEWWLRRVEH